MVFALSKKAASVVSTMFEERIVKKTYTALVKGLDVEKLRLMIGGTLRDDMLRSSYEASRKAPKAYKNKMLFGTFRKKVKDQARRGEDVTEEDKNLAKMEWDEAQDVEGIDEKLKVLVPPEKCPFYLTPASYGLFSNVATAHGGSANLLCTRQKDTVLTFFYSMPVVELSDGSCTYLSEAGKLVDGDDTWNGGEGRRWRFCLTFFEILKGDDGLNRVIMRPVTGRRHQLRLHCKSLGGHILGDWVYGDDNDNVDDHSGGGGNDDCDANGCAGDNDCGSEIADTRRMCLNAWKIQLEAGGEIVEFVGRETFGIEDEQTAG